MRILSSSNVPQIKKFKKEDLPKLKHIHTSIFYLSAIVWVGLCIALPVYANPGLVQATVQESGTKVTLLDTYFQDKHAGWVVGAGGTLLRTEDGGQVWKPLPRRTNVLLTVVTFADDQHGWVLGQNGTILHSKNGGKTWLPQISGTNAMLYGAYFLDSQTGWIVGERGTLLYTSDGVATDVGETHGVGSA